MKKSRYYVVDKYGKVTREMLYGSIFDGGSLGLSRGSYYTYYKPTVITHADDFCNIEAWIFNDRLVVNAEYVFKSKKEAYEYLRDKLKKQREALDKKIALVEKKLASEIKEL